MSDPFSHVSDSSHWHILENFDIGFQLPFGLTKFMVLEVIAAGLILLIYVPLAKRIWTGQSPKGAFWNFFEVLLTFIRDEVAKPNIAEPHHHHDDAHGGHGHDHQPSHHEAPAEHGHGAVAHAAQPGAYYCDRFVPFLWTLFLFILFCNLLGMIPFMGSPTGSLTVTAALAVVTFVYMHGNAIWHHGLIGYIKTYIPNVEAPKAISIVLVPMIFVIEVMGAFIKCFVLAVRLFANIMAGHLVLAFIMLFIVMAKDSWVFYMVTPASVMGVVLLSLLELFVAFLQAFVFTFLTAIFIGLVMNPEH